MSKFFEIFGIRNLAYLAILTAIIIAMLIYFMELRKTNEDKELDRFMVFLEHYDQIVNERNACYERIYYAWIDTDNFRADKLKDFNSLNYLLWRLSDGQPAFVAIENELLVLEIQCISYIDRLCEISVKNPKAMEILRLKESYELFFYTTRFSVITGLYEKYRSTFNLKELNQKNIQDVFENRLLIE
jgi:hypothetical protein